MLTDKGLAQLLERLNIATPERAYTKRQEETPDNADDSQAAERGLTRAMRQPHREIGYEYPVESLMPAGAKLLLPEPSDADYRQTPDHTAFHLDKQPLDYRLIIDPRAVALPYAAKHEVVHHILELMDIVNQRAGRTSLSTTTFTVDGDFDCRIALQAHFSDGDEPIQVTYDLSLDEIEELLAIKDRSWVRLWCDLISRTSDRSYLLVHENVKRQWGDDFALAEEAQWLNMWSSTTTRSAAVLFRNQLLDPGSGVVVDLVEHNNEQFPVRLPCGHLLWTMKAEISEISADIAQAAACLRDDCGRRILQDYDDAELAIRDELAQRDEAEQQDEAWNDLDLEDLSKVRHAIPVYLLPQVLQEARRSMDVPKSVSPLELSLLHCEETAFATRALEYWALRQDRIVRISSAKLFRHLMEYTMCALDETAMPRQDPALIPSGWEGFLEVLLKRIISFLVHRGCNDDSAEHQGLHYHESIYFYNCLEVEERPK